MNQIAGQFCVPIVCQRRGKAFRWKGMTGWYECDILPPGIYDYLPRREQERIQRHMYRRMADARTERLEHERTL